MATFKVDEADKKQWKQKKKNSFISEFKDTKYQELQAIQKEQRTLLSEINADKIPNKNNQL